MNKCINEEINDNPDKLNDTKKKAKDDMINATADALKAKTHENDENVQNGKIDEDSKIEDANHESIEKSDSDDSSKKEGDDEDNTVLGDDDLEKVDKTSYKILPNLQPRQNIIDQTNTDEPATMDEAVLYTNTYCETLVGFNKAGKNDIVKKYHRTCEQIVLRSYVHKEIFRKIKLISSEQLSMNSTIMNLLYEQISATSSEAKEEKYLGVRYILQRQLSQKRSYCIEKIY